MTIEEWVAYEESHEGRRDLVDGHLIVVQGGTDKHDTIVTVLFERLVGPFREQGCRTYPHNRRVVTPRGDGFYPDLVVRCGPRSSDLFDTAPSWVFEVLSPSNTDNLTIRKTVGYLSIPELEGYVQIDAATEDVVAHVRRDDQWHVVDVTGAALPVGPVVVDFAEIFSQVTAELRLGDTTS
jgi:Uma2 family endonuclease